MYTFHTSHFTGCQSPIFFSVEIEMNDLSDMLNRVNPKTSIAWFTMGLLVKFQHYQKLSNDSDSDNSEVLTPDAPRMRRNASSYGSFSSNASSSV